mgnify:CR=1 FL=1
MAKTNPGRVFEDYRIGAAMALPKASAYQVLGEGLERMLSKPGGPEPAAPPTPAATLRRSSARYARATSTAYSSSRVDLRPGVTMAARELGFGTCAGAEFLGWMDLPDRITEGQFARIEAGGAAAATFLRRFARRFFFDLVLT